MQRRPLASGLALLFASAAASVAAPLVVCTGLPPSVSAGEGTILHRFAGFERALLDGYAESRGRSVELRLQSDFGAALAHTASGDCDLAAGMITRTREREERLAFSRPYFPVRVLAIEPAGRTTLTPEGLAGKTVLTVPHTVADDILQRLPGVRILYLQQDDPRPWQRLAAGEADALVLESPVVLEVLSAHPEWHVSLALSPRQDYAFAFPLGSPLRPEVDAYLQQLQAGGDYRRLLVESFGEENAALVMESFEGEPAAGAPPAPFDVEAATAAYLDRLSPEEKERSDAYFEGGYWLQLWSFLYGLGVAWLLLGSGLSRRMRALGERLSRRKPLATAAYGVQYVVLTTLLTFPLAVYQGFIREHRYGLATQGFGGWLRDQAVGLALGVVLLSLLVTVLYGVFRRAPSSWWLWGTGVGLIFLVVVFLIAPVYIDPLFNTYKPLEDALVKEDILSLARASGIAADDVYQFDASRQTTRISANVSGLLGTMRIRLNDNLLERCSRAEIRAVMGHEMGHYVLHHIYESIVFFGVVLAGGFGFLRWGFEHARRRWGRAWGVAGIGDVAGLPLLAALFSIYFFFLTPVLNTFIRSNEAEADIYGLQAAREPEGFAEVALKLSDYRKLDPGPLEEWIFFDHPSGRARIHMAMAWKAEHPEE